MVHEGYFPDPVEGHLQNPKGADEKFVFCFERQGKCEILRFLIYSEGEFNFGILDIYLLILLYEFSKR